MNASDAHEYVVEGFKMLKLDLSAPDPQDAAKKAESNAKGREMALARVRAEYAAYGLQQPHEYALSITARCEFGIGVVIDHGQREDVA